MNSNETPRRTTGWKRLTPASARRAYRRALQARRRRRQPGTVALGDLRRVSPIDPGWGFRRGRPIDRGYIEAFLESSRADIRGRVLEVGGSAYTRRFGSDVERTDVLNVDTDDPDTTIVADLVDAPHLPDDTFDCVVLTQVLQYVYDVPAALRTVQRILAPGGVLLATVPGITRISRLENASWGDWWRFTSTSAARLGEEAFGPGNVEVRSYGNVLAAAAFLYGLAQEDLEPEELHAHDPLYEVIVALRAVKRRRGG